MTRDLQTLRGKFFFWLGVVVFPLFWVLWMSPRQFTSRQMDGSRIWAVVYGLALLLVPAFNDRLHTFLWSFSQISFQVGLVLWIWLFLRTMPFWTFVVFFLVSIDIIAITSSLMLPWVMKQAPHPAAMIFILIPAVMHLLVEPVRGSTRQTARD